MYTSRRNTGRQGGLSLIELIMFILVVSVGIVGILSVMNYTSSKSADPLIQKQALAIAESLMEEITLQPFTVCDPDDANVENPPCATTAEALGPEPGETRGNNATPFDNVNDYAGLTMNSGIIDLANGGVISGLKAYSAAVNIANVAVGTGLDQIPATDSLRIDVTVTHTSGVLVTLTGYRLRYAPTSP